MSVDKMASFQKLTRCRSTRCRSTRCRSTSCPGAAHIELTADEERLPEACSELASGLKACPEAAAHLVYVTGSPERKNNV
jgi:hypothetical protein